MEIWLDVTIAGRKTKQGKIELLSQWTMDSTGQYWLVLNGTGSVEGGTGWYLVVLGQYGALLVDI